MDENYGSLLVGTERVESDINADISFEDPVLRDIAERLQRMQKRYNAQREQEWRRVTYD